MKQHLPVPNQGDSAGPRATRVEDVMTRQVETVAPSTSVGQVRELMTQRGFHSLPVVDASGEPVGIVTTTDLLPAQDDGAEVRTIMTENVYTVPGYSGVHVAARIMRNHRIHHVVVTHEKKIVGLVSSFDLLRLVENKRFVDKQPPSKSTKGGKRKRREQH